MKIRIQTAQNVEIEYEIAGVGYRFLAALIDLSLFLGYFALVWILSESTTIGMLMPEWSLYVFVIPPVPLLLYPVLCEIFMRGQTVGKRAMNLKVVRVDGGEPSIGAYLLRWLFWLLEANPFAAISGLGAVSLISIVSTRLGQRVGDIAAGTTVVRLPREEAEEVPGAVGALSFESHYEPLLPQVVRLSAGDIDTIRRGYAAVEAGAEENLASTIAYRVADVLGIERHRVGETTQFLQTVLKDWAFFQRGVASARADERREEADRRSDPFDPLY